MALMSKIRVASTDLKVRFYYVPSDVTESLGLSVYHEQYLTAEEFCALYLRELDPSIEWPLYSRVEIALD